MSINLGTRFLGKLIKSPIYNASGVHCVTFPQLDELAMSSAGALITKSCTVNYRDGNPKPRYYDMVNEEGKQLGSINSSGLPNLSYKAYQEYAHKKRDKPLFISVSGMNLGENLQILGEFNEDPYVELVELNLSCPNIVGKPQTGYCFEDMEKMLNEVTKIYKKPLGIKLPPYFDMVHFKTAAEIFNKFQTIRFLTCCNSLGNGLVIDSESESVVIKPKNGFGGIGGIYIKPTALANVHAFSKLCPDKHIIGCGGVQNGKDVFEHILCGASLVQVGSALYREGLSIFDRLTEELEEIMTIKGYETLSDFRGKLKYL